MSEELRRFKEIGSSIPAHDSSEFDSEQYVGKVDFERFNRGREFYKRNLSQCTIAMLFSLVTGLSLYFLIEVLVATGKSSSSGDAFKRYWHTLGHIVKWHYGNVWDKNSDAAKSIRQVRDMHSRARKLMIARSDDVVNKDGGSNNEASNGNNGKCIRKRITSATMFVSQYEMSLVQCGFIGGIIMYPEGFGLRYTKRDLEDYVYFWRWIGLHLGIEDRFNVCVDGFETAHRICKAVETDLVVPALETPPKEFLPMAYAITDGINEFSRSYLHSPYGIVSRAYEITGRRWPYKISVADKLRHYAFKLYTYVLGHVQWFNRLMNRMVEKMYKCDSLT